MLDRLAAFGLECEQRCRGLSPTPELEEAYRGSREQIEEVLADTEFFHGTGRLRYAPVNGSKYNGIDPNRQVDVLDGILKDGLRPQEDLFSEVFTGEHQPSVSLTHARMYAGVYAKQFEPEGDGVLDYEYGSQAFWWLFFSGRMILDMVTDSQWYVRWAQHISALARDDAAYKERLERRGRYAAHMDDWQRNFRNDDVYNGRPYQVMCAGRSTIQDNYGMVVGVKPGSVKAVPVLHGYVRRYEVRAGESIPPDKISYLEVPQAAVERTRALVAMSSAPDLPVLPMELIELHHQRKPFVELTQSHPYRDAPELLTDK